MWEKYTLRCINGLEEIQSGEIKLQGNVINKDKTKWHLIRQRIGMDVSKLRII